MTDKKLVESLQRYNCWRRGADIPQPSPEEIGCWIDLACRRLEEKECGGIGEELTPTPETDAAVIESRGQWSFVLKETCQRLERERDEAREVADRCRVALHDAIQRPKGVVPQSAERFYKTSFPWEAAK